MNIKNIISHSSADLKCKICDNPSRIAFNWEIAKKGKNHELLPLFEHLKLVKSLKFGQLYSCDICGVNWVLDNNSYAMTRVPDDKRDILIEWNESKLLIDKEHLSILDNIGAKATKYWMGADRVITIPCAVLTSSGELMDPAIVMITERPPIDSFYSRFRLYQNVKKIKSSRFALPLDVRCATTLAKEVRMGFSPTRVEEKKGIPFVLHWGTVFFYQDGIVGNDIRLSTKTFRIDEPITIVEPDLAHATYFFADWFEGAEYLNKIVQKNQIYPKFRAFWNRLFR